MLSYRNINKLFIAIILLLLILAGNQWIPIYIMIIPFILYILVLTYGVVNIRADFFLKSIQTLKNKDQILLTFDDGPHPVYTPLILDLLDQYEAKAFFFVIGEHAEKMPLLLQEIRARGHRIGNHSWSHDPYFDFFSVNKMVDEIKRTNEVIEKITGVKPVYFRPPFGITNPRIAKLLHKTGMKSVSWSYRSYDTKSRSNERIVAEIQKKIEGGEILLFHDPIPRTFVILKEILPWLNEKYNLKANM